MRQFIITGVSSGLGLALAENITALKYQVIGVGRNDSEDSILNHDYYKFVECDLSNKNDYNLLVEKMELSGDVKGVTFINNAGVIAPIGMQVDDEEAFRAHFEVNFFSVVSIVSSLLRATQANEFSLNVINISSGAANRPIQGWGAYCASKSAVKMWLEACLDHPDFDKLDNVDPGIMNTKMQETIREQSVDDFPDVNKFKNMLGGSELKNPNDVARKIVDSLKLCK